jgi:hypothetical protein
MQNNKLFITGNIIANTLREDNVFRVAYTLESALKFDKSSNAFISIKKTY